MTDIERKIIVLKHKKEKLQKNKQKNEEEIKKCDEEIAYYKERSRQFLTILVINNHNLTSYRNIECYEKSRPINLFNIFLQGTTYTQKRIKQLERESDKICEARQDALNIVDRYTNRKRYFQRQNINISRELEEINLELETLSEEITEEKPKTKIITRRNNNDRYQTNTRR